MNIANEKRLSGSTHIHKWVDQWLIINHLNSMRSMGQFCKKKEKNFDYARAHEGRKGEEASPADTLFCYLRPQFN